MAKALFRSRVLLISLAGLATVIQAHAQYADQYGRQWTTNMGGVFNNPMSALASTMIWGKINEQVMVNAVKRKQAGGNFSSSSAGTPSTAGERSVLSNNPQVDAEINKLVHFRPTGTRLMLKTLTEKLGGNANQQAQTTHLLSVLMESYEKEAASKGYANDLALALSSFIAFNCAAYQQKTIAPDDKILILRDLIGVVAVQKGLFAGLTDQQKQQTYETLIMTGGLAYLSYEDAKNRNSMDGMRLFKQFAGQNLKTVLGIEPDTLDFTAEALNSAK